MASFVSEAYRLQEVPFPKAHVVLTQQEQAQTLQYAVKTRCITAQLPEQKAV